MSTRGVPDHLLPDVLCLPLVMGNPAKTMGHRYALAVTRKGTTSGSVPTPGRDHQSLERRKGLHRNGMIDLLGSRETDRDRAGRPNPGPGHTETIYDRPKDRLADWCGCIPSS